jgi:signal transduction histidine kinase/FixJ family two-component response regulator
MVTTTQTPGYDIIPRRYAVLIVDDFEADRVAYRRYLELANDLDCHISDCDSAESAIEFYDRQRPDVILLDYLLPDCDGLEFLQHCADRGGALPIVIMLTGQGSEAVAVEAMKYGVKDYLVKGTLTARKLLDSIIEALAAKKLQIKIDLQLQQRELFANIALKISHSADLSHILRDTVLGIEKLFSSDRAIVYRFGPDRNGTIVAESVFPGWSSLISNQIEDACVPSGLNNEFDRYLRGDKTVIENIQTTDLKACDIQILQDCQVKALLAVPILVRLSPGGSQLSLWGLLIIHHCRATHKWQADEISFLDELAMQMAIAIQQTELLSDLHASIAQQQLVMLQLGDRMAEIEQTNLLLSETSHALEKRNQDLDEFAHIASHDLQAPLRGVSNLTGWLAEDLEGQLSAENQHQIELIQSRILQMSDLINGLLQYALVGRENIDAVDTNLSQLLSGVVDLLAAPGEIQVSFSANLPTIKTQDLLLKQVLSNLIGNAIKYNDKPDGRIEILVEEQDFFWCFTVLDNGPGISPENHKRIFGVFQTLDNGSAAKGTGIGLAVVRKIVESRGGLVWVESEIGQGSKFLFTWRKAN